MTQNGSSGDDVYGRVAAKLLELAERYGMQKEGIEIELRLTQAELASWVGTTRESVNKVLGTFRGQGLIEVKGELHYKTFFARRRGREMLLNIWDALSGKVK